MAERGESSLVPEEAEHPSLPSLPESEIPGQESELSPEILEQVMSRVKDINAKGTGYTAIRFKYLNSPKSQAEIQEILTQGLLSQHYDSEQKKPDESFVDQWKKTARKKRMGEVHFHIVGRDISNIQKGAWHLHNSEIGFVLNLEGYEELVSAPKDESSGLTRTFRISQPEVVSKYKSVNELIVKDILDMVGLDRNSPLGEVRRKIIENKDAILERHKDSPKLSWLKGVITEAESNTEDFSSLNGLFSTSPSRGFLGYFRIPPRNMNGIVLRPVLERSPEEIERLRAQEMQGKDPNEKWSDFDETFFQTKLNKYTEKDPKKIDAKVRRIVSLMSAAYKGKEQLIMPIYDSEGNLLWPRKMTNQEIKDSGTNQAVN